MHSPNPEPDTRSGKFQGWFDTGESAQKDTHTHSTTPEIFVRRLLTNWVLVVRNWFRRRKIHYYHSSDLGTYFFLEESLDCTDEVYITSYQSLIEATDLIKIEYASDVLTYQIIALQQYSNAPNICVARLREL